MNLWLGEEQEGTEQGILTLFVEARFLTKEKIELIKAIAKCCSVSRIYFGANRKNVWYFSKTIETIKQRKILECSKLPAAKIARQFDVVVLRNDVSSSHSLCNIVAKIDNTKEVVMFSEALKTSLIGLNSQGMYVNDKKIY